ncbi:MAG: hypothetical protein AAFX76_09570 [Planctomycetota bacterium]
MNRPTPSDPRRLVKSASLALVATAAGAAALGVAAWLLDRRSPDLPVGDFFRDLSSTGNVPPLTGAASQLGLALWAAAAAVAGYNALRHARLGGRPAVARFLAATGVLSAALLLDDMFLVHEELAYPAVGLGERSVLGLFVLAAAALFVVYRRFILSGPALPVLLTACVCFAVMLGVDRVQEQISNQNLRYLLEDGMKFFGIVAWLTWVVLTCLRLDQPPPDADPR